MVVYEVHYTENVENGGIMTVVNVNDYAHVYGGSLLICSYFRAMRRR